MNQNSLYRDIAVRCDGDIYMGVVGPVRSGKSTFIKRFMELLVLPNTQNRNRRERMMDEMPIGGAGRTIMTTQPKFIPDEAAQIHLKDEANLRVRLVDCVGYLIRDVLGLDEDGGARMVRTPWFDYDIPFEEAAELGTRKVIREHATMGIVVTTDGTVTEFPRSAYVDAEERVVRELKELGKPFVVVMNTNTPGDAETLNLSHMLSEKYDVPVLPTDVVNMSLTDINSMLERVLFEFPLTEIHLSTPAWLTALDETHYLVSDIMTAMTQSAETMLRVRDHEKLRTALEASELVAEARVNAIQLNSGAIDYRIDFADGLFFRILGEASGQAVEGEEHLLKLMKELVAAKREYDQVADALQAVRATGYGMVAPEMAEMKLEEPQIVKQGNHFGVRLKASAPSLHMIRVDIQTEVSPIVGTEKQSEELVEHLLGGFKNDPGSLWSTEIFGKSLNSLVREGLSGKLLRMPDDVRMKVQQSLSKIINEGNGGMICILL